MSLEDFNFEIQAFNRRQADQNEQRMYEIWLQERVVKATDEEGKYYIFKTFDEFLNLETEKIKRKTQTFAELKQIAKLKKKLEEGGGQ